MDIDDDARRLLEGFLGERAPELLPLPVVHGSPLAFRHRARLAVRGRASAPKLGIFQEGTHDIVDIPRCTIHHPLINETARELRDALRTVHAPPYSDRAHQGLVRYAQMAVERRTKTVQMVIVTTETTPGASMPLFDELRRRLGPRLQGLFWNGNPERTNAILGAEFQKLAGADALEESIGGARVFFPPGAFGQSHLELADSIVGRVHSWVPDGARVLELYAGTGPIGLGVVKHSASVTFNEIAEASLDGLRMGIQALPAGLDERCEVVSGSAETAASFVAKHDVIIADPPRKGLEPAVREALLSTPPARFAYVACGLPAFLRDARDLLDTRRLTLRNVVVFDLFPFTEHVEVVALFERA